MPKSAKHSRNAPHAKLSSHPVNGHAVHNSILLALPTEERKAVFSKMDFVEMPVHSLLNEMAEPIKHGYFINSGLASILNVMSDGKSVEVGLTGNEGFVGLPLAVGFESSPTRALIQIKGTAFQIGAKDMIVLLEDCPQLSKRIHRYAQELALQVTQVAACNRLHQVEERLARWLLMSQDRVGSPSFLLTQEFLSHMLGTRRASVTVAAGVLQKARLITYKRGQVKIENRAKLEAAACECYEILKRQLKSWHNNLK
jgi:CRP-like cAMP-binding protein